MGIGVYESNFHGRGASFLIDGPLATEEDYEAYLKDEDGDPSLSHEQWAQEQYDDANEDMIIQAEEALAQVGFTAENRDRFDAPPAKFDRDFVAITDDDIVQIGWRSWSHDFVIGVGPTAAFQERLDFDAEYALRELGRDIDSFTSDYDAHVALVEEFTRLSIMKSGIECRYRTGGYTTSAYVLPDDADAKIELLKHEIGQSAAKLKLEKNDAITTLGAEERGKVARTAISEQMQVLFPVAVVEGADRGLNLYLVSDDYEDGYALVASMQPPAELAAYIDALPQGMTALPRNAETEAWFSAYQKSARPGTDLVLSAEEVAAAIEDDVVIRLYDSSDNSLEHQVVAQGPEKTAELRPGA